MICTFNLCECYLLMVLKNLELILYDKLLFNLALINGVLKNRMLTLLEFKRNRKFKYSNLVRNLAFKTIYVQKLFFRMASKMNVSYSYTQRSNFKCSCSRLILLFPVYQFFPHYKAIYYCFLCVRTLYIHAFFHLLKLNKSYIINKL